jgi:hypothetical protein
MAVLVGTAFDIGKRDLLFCKNKQYEKRRVSRISPSLLLKINLQNTSTLQLNNIIQIKSK